MLFAILDLCHSKHEIVKCFPTLIIYLDNFSSLDIKLYITLYIHVCTHVPINLKVFYMRRVDILDISKCMTSIAIHSVSELQTKADSVLIKSTTL